MAEVARVKGETKTLAPKFHGILLHPRMQSTAFCPQHQRCWGDVVRIFFVTLFEHSEPQMRRHLELPKAESTAHVWSGALHLSFRVHKLSFPMKSRQRQHDLDLLKMFVFFLFSRREIHYLRDLYGFFGGSSSQSKIRNIYWRAIVTGPSTATSDLNGATCSLRSQRVPNHVGFPVFVFWIIPWESNHLLRMAFKDM